MNRREARFQKKLQKYKGKKRLQVRSLVRISKASNMGHITKNFSYKNFEAR